VLALANALFIVTCLIALVTIVNYLALQYTNLFGNTSHKRNICPVLCRVAILSASVFKLHVTAKQQVFQTPMAIVSFL
jgi:hypothetical protein